VVTVDCFTEWWFYNVVLWW